MFSLCWKEELIYKSNNYSVAYRTIRPISSLKLEWFNCLLPLQ